MLTGCRDDEMDFEDMDMSGISEYRPGYMDYSNNFLGNVYTGSENVKIEYNNHKISKRISNLIYYSDPNSVLTPTKSVDNITYNGNEILINTEYVDYHWIKPSEKKILMNGKRISQIIVNGEGFSDTLKMSYHKGFLDEVITYRRGIRMKSRYYFNHKGNLDSIISRYGVVRLNSENEFVYDFIDTDKRRRKEIFTNFDTSENPLKNLMIFDETFCRSLSKNNYRSYRSSYYDQSGQLMGYSGSDWKFVYQGNHVDFSR